MESVAAVMEAPSQDLAAAPAASFETIEVADPTGEEVLVEIGASSLCHTDVSIAEGKNEEPMPMVLGHEGAGIVRAVGERVTSVEPGDHVVLGRIACGRCEYCRKGKSNLCAARREFQAKGTLRTGDIRFNRGGEPLHHCHGVSSFSEYTVVTEEIAIPITDEIPLEEATLLGCGVFTGFGAVTSTADVEPGSSVAVFGCGGVGLSAVQAARIRGAGRVIAVDPVEGKLDVAADLGATDTVHASGDDAIDEVTALTGGGADYTFEVTGIPGVAMDAVHASAKDGAAVLVGVPPDGKHSVDLDLYSIVIDEREVLGSFNGSFNLPLAIPVLAEFVADGRLRLDPMITDVGPLSDLNDAMAEMAAGSDAIRRVLVP